MRRPANHVEDLRPRYRYFVIALSICFVFLLSRIWYLQAMKGEEFARLAQNNRIRVRRVPATRGMILDRNETILVDNRPSFRVSVVPEDMNDVDRVVSRLQGIVDSEPKKMRSLIVRHRKRDPFYPVLIKDDISRNQLAYLETHKMDLPGIIIDAAPPSSEVWMEGVR
jgi:penicillin-binding protein 2